MNQQLSNITSETVKAYQADISSSLSKSSAKRKASAINKFLEWAGQEGYVTTNSLTKLPVNRQLPVAKLLAWASFTLGMAIFTIVFVQQVKLPIPFRFAPAKETQPEARLIFEETASTPIPTPSAAAPDSATPNPEISPTPTPSPVFSTLDLLGSLSISQLSIDNDLSLDGNLKIGGVTRFNSMGRLASLTGYYQDSGLFEIDQGAADWAKLEKVMTVATGVASNDVLTLTLDESVLTTGSNYDTLTLNRTNAASDGYALLVDNGNVRFDGDVSYAGTLTDVSDIRLKENFQNIQNPLEILQGINGKFFNMIGSDKKEAGVIAQDVQLVLPEAVNTIDTQKGYLGVSYTSLIPVMIEGIKELANITKDVSMRTKIVSPIVETEFLSPVPERDLTVRLADDSRFTIQDSDSNEVAGIDAAGNATFSGEVRAKRLAATNLDEIEVTLKKAEDDIDLLTQKFSNELADPSQDATIGQIELVNLITDKLNTLLASTLRVEANGDVTVTGNLYVAGNVTTDKLIIANSAVLDTPDVSGATIGSNASAGNAKIASGSAQITIKNGSVSDNSLIYVTPTTPSGNQVLYIKEKQPGSFVIGFEKPAESDVTFNWWVVDLLTP